MYPNDWKPFSFLTGYPSVFALKDAADAAEKEANEGARKGTERDKSGQEVENERQIVSVKDAIEEVTEGLADMVEKGKEVQMIQILKIFEGFLLTIVLYILHKFS